MEFIEIGRAASRQDVCRIRYYSESLEEKSLWKECSEWDTGAQMDQYGH